MMRTGDPQQAAAHAVGCGSVVYVHRDGGVFVVGPARPAAPPYVAAAPGDGADVVLARIGRLAVLPGKPTGCGATGTVKSPMPSASTGPNG